MGSLGERKEVHTSLPEEGHFAVGMADPVEGSQGPNDRRPQCPPDDICRRGWQG